LKKENPVGEKGERNEKTLAQDGVVLQPSLVGPGYLHGNSLGRRLSGETILLVNPGGAGGSSDLTMRAVTSVAADYLGQPVIVQIKAGGGGAIGTEFVVRAAPDGYTLLSGAPNWNSILPAVEGISKGPDELAAVCRINYSAGFIVARSDAPFKTFKEMIEWAKANPGKLVFGNSGPWGIADIDWKFIMHKTGIKSRVVPTTEAGRP